MRDDEIYERVMKDPRTISSLTEFVVQGRVIFSGGSEAKNAPDFPSSMFDHFTLTHLLRTNRAVHVIKDDGTVIMYSMKNRPVDDDED